MNETGITRRVEICCLIFIVAKQVTGGEKDISLAYWWLSAQAAYSIWWLLTQTTPGSLNRINSGQIFNQYIVVWLKETVNPLAWGSM